MIFIRKPWPHVQNHWTWELQVPPWKNCTRDAMKPWDVSEDGGLVRCKCRTWLSLGIPWLKPSYFISSIVVARCQIDR